MSTRAGLSPSPISPDHDYNNIFTATGKAVIGWETASAKDQYLVEPDPKNRHIIFEACLENDTSQHLSFFRLRIPIRHKHLQDIVLYLHICPDHISSLDWTFDFDAPDPVRTKLSSHITRLQFNLCKPAELIVPDQGFLKPKKPATAIVIKSLESLVTALTVSVYLEHTTLSKARLRSIARAVQSGQSRPVPRYHELHRLYKGAGGKIYCPINDDNVSTDSGSPPSIHVDSPPSYDEIGPGPPMPPIPTDCSSRPCIGTGQGKRHRQCSGSGTDDGSPSSRPGKRGPLDGYSGRNQVAAARNTLPSWAMGLITSLAEVNEIVTRQNQMIKDLQNEIWKLRDQLKTRDDQHDILEQRVDNADVAIGDLDATVIEHTESLADVEGNLIALREDMDVFSCRRSPELEDIVSELKAEVMTRLRNALETS